MLATSTDVFALVVQTFNTRKSNEPKRKGHEKSSVVNIFVTRSTSRNAQIPSDPNATPLAFRTHHLRQVNFWIPYMHKSELEETFGAERWRRKAEEKFSLEDGDTTMGDGKPGHASITSRREPLGRLTRSLRAWGVGKKQVRLCGLLGVNRSSCHFRNSSKRLISIFRPVDWNDKRGD